jgi:hypothetical protein
MQAAAPLDPDKRLVFRKPPVEAVLRT